MPRAVRGEHQITHQESSYLYKGGFHENSRL
jgi:hypothetical protein